MTTFEYIMIFIISWWVLLFMVLPFKAGAAEKTEQNEYHSAPAKTFLKQKLIITSILAVVATAGISWAIQAKVITLWAV